MGFKLYRAAEVCSMVELQPYVLRSWEKEFPWIGVQKSEDGPRLYRQSDIEHVLRIKQLVFGEGLTLAGARRRLEESELASRDESSDALDLLASDARNRIAQVRDGLRSLLKQLSSAPGSDEPSEEYRLEPPPGQPVRPARSAAMRGKGRVMDKQPVASIVRRKPLNA
jgi:DNA-binding transcriptional MerR regulator